MAVHEQLKPNRVGLYKFHDTILGKGNFACVYKACHKLVGCDVALKVINVDEIEEEYVYRNLTREARILRGLRHPNIIRLYETIESDNLYCLSLELVRGTNLSQFMKKQEGRRISEKLARVFFYQMLIAVEYMHRLNYIHRDLKQENILIECGHVVKIVDFGLSNVYYPCYQLRTHCGSAEYAAPELFKSHSLYGTPADLWSLGVILYGIIIGSLPFTMKTADPSDPSSSDRYRQRFVQRISKGLMQDNWEKMEGLSSECWDLLHDLLQPDQFRRIRIGSALVHRWITKDTYLKKRLPQRRKDLYRQFEPEIVQFLSDKLKVPVSRIDKHLHARHTLQVNSKITALFYMVRDTLVKDVLYTPSKIETSFLYRFEIWRQSRSLLSSSQKMDFDGLVTGQSSILDEEDGQKIPKKVGSKESGAKVHESNPKAKTEGNLKQVFPTSKRGLKLPKTNHQNTAEPMRTNSIQSVADINVADTRTPYKSYKQSRPKKSELKETHSSLKKPNKCSDERLQDADDNRIRGTQSRSQDTEHAIKGLNSSASTVQIKIMPRNASVIKQEEREFRRQVKTDARLTFNESKMENSVSFDDGEFKNALKASFRANSGRYREYKRSCSSGLPQETRMTVDDGLTRTPGKVPIHVAGLQTQNDPEKRKTPFIKNTRPKETPNRIRNTVTEAEDTPCSVRQATARVRHSEGVRPSPEMQQNRITILKNNNPKGKNDPMASSPFTPSRIPVKNLRYGPPAPFSQRLASKALQSRKATVAERIVSRNGDANGNWCF